MNNLMLNSLPVLISLYNLWTSVGITTRLC